MIYDIKDFGAVGDGIINDSNAFKLASEQINALKGGHLIISSGTYLVGKDENDEDFDIYDTIAYLNFIDCHGIIIEFCGSEVIYKSGQYYGGFIKENNQYIARPNEVSFINNPFIHKANLKTFISLNNCNNVFIKNLQVDGGKEQVVVGGKTFSNNGFNIGWQYWGYGIRIINSRNISIENCALKNFCSDGILIQNIPNQFDWMITNDTDKYLNQYSEINERDVVIDSGIRDIYENGSIMIKNTKSEYNGRQGISLISSSNVHIVNCDFNHNGKNANNEQGRISSPPKAGIDIEAEKQENGLGINYNVIIENCRIINNAGNGLVADSGNSFNVKLKNSLLWGNSNRAAWITKPGFEFDGCTIYGTILGRHYEGAEYNRSWSAGQGLPSETHPLHAHYIDSDTGKMYQFGKWNVVDEDQIIQIFGPNYLSHTTGGKPNIPLPEYDVWRTISQQTQQVVAFYLLDRSWFEITPKLKNTVEYGLKFRNCVFEDKPHPKYGLHVSAALLNLNKSSSVEIENCTFKLHYDDWSSNLINYILDGPNLRAITLVSSVYDDNYNSTLTLLQSASKVFNNTFYLYTNKLQTSKELVHIRSAILKENMFIHKVLEGQYCESNSGNHGLITISNCINLGKNVIINNELVNDSLVFQKVDEVNPGNYNEDIIYL